MLVTLYGDAKEAQSNLEGHYILQPDLVNKKPCWFNEAVNAIWSKNGWWMIGAKEHLGGYANEIYSPDNVEDPLQALTWEYYYGGWHESKDILVTEPGNL